MNDMASPEIPTNAEPKPLENLFTHENSILSQVEAIGNLQSANRGLSIKAKEALDQNLGSTTIEYPEKIKDAIIKLEESMHVRTQKRDEALQKAQQEHPAIRLGDLVPYIPHELRYDELRQASASDLYDMLGILTRHSIDMDDEIVSQAQLKLIEIYQHFKPTQKVGQIDVNQTNTYEISNDIRKNLNSAPLTLKTLEYIVSQDDLEILNLAISSIEKHTAGDPTYFKTLSESEVYKSLIEKVLNDPENMDSARLPVALETARQVVSFYEKSNGDFDIEMVTKAGNYLNSQIEKTLIEIDENSQILDTLITKASTPQMNDILTMIATTIAKTKGSMSTSSELPADFAINEFVKQLTDKNDIIPDVTLVLPKLPGSSEFELLDKLLHTASNNYHTVSDTYQATIEKYKKVIEVFNYNVKNVLISKTQESAHKMKEKLLQTETEKRNKDAKNDDVKRGKEAILRTQQQIERQRFDLQHRNSGNKTTTIPEDSTKTHLEKPNQTEEEPFDIEGYRKKAQERLEQYPKFLSSEPQQKDIITSLKKIYDKLRRK